VAYSYGYRVNTNTNAIDIGELFSIDQFCFENYWHSVGPLDIMDACYLSIAKLAIILSILVAF